MSIMVMARVFPKKFGCAKLKAVALKLADHAGADGGSIHPSKATICAHTELSRATVYRCIDRLLEMGVLRVVEASQGGGKRDTTVYALSLPAIDALPNSGSSDPSQGETGGNLDPSQEETDPSQVETVPVSELETRTVIEPSNKLASARKGSAKKKPPSAVAAATKNSDVKRERPEVLPHDWQIPDDWIAEALGERPECAAILAAEAKRFADFYRDRGFVATADGWHALFVKWWNKARVPQSEFKRKLTGAGSGATTVRDTSESFTVYTARMIAEGKYKPAGGAHERVREKPACRR